MIPDDIEPPAWALDEPRANSESDYGNIIPTTLAEAKWRRAAGAGDSSSVLILNDKGTPRALLANAITAFRTAPEWQGRINFDCFRQRTVLRGRAPWMTTGADEIEWRPTFDILAAEWLQHARIHVSPDVAAQAVEVVAHDNEFHPVRNYLERCRWDGEPRLDHWATQYLGAPDSTYVQAGTARWMISAVARVSDPGTKADCCLILEGRQGLLKSTALKTLGSPWLTDDLADLGSKDSSLQLSGAWIIELSELDAMNRMEVGRIKAFMARSTDRFRPPYGKRVIEVPRQCVFAGSVNVNSYLRDETGGRRFWPIVCSKIDIDGLSAARDGLWAEARDRYLAGEAWGF